MATFRAIEDGLWVVRPVLSGVSGVIDPYGQVQAQTDSFSGGEPTATAVIVSRSTPTLYVRFGDWFAYLCVAGLAALAGWTIAAGMHSARQYPRRPGVEQWLAASLECNSVKRFVMKQMHGASGDGIEYDYVITRRCPASSNSADQPNHTLERAGALRAAGALDRSGRNRREL